MNLNNINNKEYLLELLNNKERLNEDITQSRGYVLRLMEKFNLKPNLSNLLTDEVNVHALNFIVKNYELTKQEKDSLRKYFNDNGKFIVESDADEVLSLEGLEEHIISLKRLPKNTIIPFGLFNKYTKQIEEIHMSEDNDGMETIVVSSVRNFTLDEFLSLDYDYLVKNMYLFHKVDNFFGDEKFQKLYKKIIFDKFKKDGESLPSISDFKKYHFNSGDGDFIRELLTNERSYSLKDYNRMSSINGFTELITKIEYFERFNDRSLIGFSFGETVKNRLLIQNVFLNGTRSIDDLVSKDCSIEQFKEIIDSDFIGRIIEQSSIYLYRNSSEETTEQKEKALHLRNVFLDYLLKNFETDKNINNIDISFFVKEMFAVLEGDVLGDDLYKENAASFLKEYFGSLLKSENVHNFLIKSSGYSLVNKNSLDLIGEAVLKNPSINLLYVLLDYLEQNKKNNNWQVESFKKKIVGFIGELVPNLDKDSSSILAKAFDYRLPIVLPLTRVVVNNGFDDNFLNYREYKFDDIPERIQRVLFSVDKNFGKYILENKYKVPSDVLYGVLNSSSGNKNNLNFMIKYVDLHKDELLLDQKFINSVLKNPKGKEIIKLNDTEVNVRNYNDFLDNAIIVSAADEARKLNKKDESYFSDKESVDISEARTKVSALGRELTWEFLDKKTDDLLLKKEFGELSLVRRYGLSSDHRQKFINYVNDLSYDNLLMNIDDKNFIELLNSEVDYNGKTEVKFAKFTARENTVLAELLFPYFKDKTHVFSMFRKDNLDFINECAIKNTPSEIFYSYDFTISKGRTYGSYVSNRFTPEEVFRAYKNVEKSGGFFSNIGVNASFSHFFSDNFANDEVGFLKLLSMAKKEDHKLYVIMSHSDMFRDFVEDGADKKSLDQRFMDYFRKNYEIDILLSGIKIILDEVKNDHLADNISVNQKLSHSVIDRAIHNTYYDQSDYTAGGKYMTKYFSDFSDEESEKLLGLLFKEAPLYLLSRHVIGSIKDVSAHMGSNIKKYVNDDINVVDLLIYPHAATKVEYFSLDASSNDNRCNKYVDNMVNGLISYCSCLEDNTGLDYLSFLIQQKIFFNDEVQYNYKYRHINGYYGGIVEYLSEDKSFMEKLSICENHLFLEKVLETKLDAPRIRNKI